MACGLLALLLSLPPAHNRSEPSPHRAPAVACEQMVECLNSSSSSSPSRPLHPSHTCPGEPECSGRGKCHGYAEDGSPRCECSAAFFGRDCSHKRHDCASLRSCADCQNDANGKFCGWCADGRYCVPKHVHRGLVRRGRGCATWYEDSCPARNRSVSRGGPEAGMISEFGDDTSVALAEALVAMIDEAGGEGTSSRLAVTSVLGLSALTLWCLRRERKAVERRRRFEEFMAEEQRMLHSSEPVHLSLPVSCRQLGPTADEARGLNASAMAEALGMSGGGGASHASLPPSKPPTRTHCVVERSAASPEARERVEDKASVEEEKEEERMHFEFREAVRQDIEERKAQRRAATEEAREKAAAEKREAAEQAVLQQLRGEAQMMRQAQPTSTLTTVTCSSGSPAEALCCNTGQPSTPPADAPQAAATPTGPPSNNIPQPPPHPTTTPQSTEHSTGTPRTRGHSSTTPQPPSHSCTPPPAAQPYTTPHPPAQPTTTPEPPARPTTSPQPPAPQATTPQAAASPLSEACTVGAAADSASPHSESAAVQLYSAAAPVAAPSKPASHAVPEPPQTKAEREPEPVVLKTPESAPSLRGPSTDQQEAGKQAASMAPSPAHATDPALADAEAEFLAALDDL